VRVLVDTSAWVDFLNGFPSPAADALAELLQGDDDVCTCGIVVAEVFQGLRRELGREAIRRSFQDMVFLEPSGIHLYLRAAELYRALRQRGTTVRSTVDCIIAAIAEDNGCDLLARDRDMDAILRSGLSRARRWQAPSRRT
jgi:predicted nucleic acid-binding protein